MRCQAINKNYKQCSRKCKSNKLVCGIHSKMKNVKLINYKYLKNVICIQSFIRRYLILKYIKLKGPYIFNKKKMHNETDFVSYDKLIDIPFEDLFTCQDKNGFYYCFNIKSLKILLESNKNINPYTQNLFTNDTILRYNKIIEYFEKTKKKFNIINELPDNINDKIKLDCVSLFQKMDKLNLYTQINWFIDLSINQLKRLYYKLEDIWNYRLGLTSEQKKKYTINGKAFTIKPRDIKFIMNKTQLQNILLNEFNNLLTQGQTKEDITTACYWILTGLTMVSCSAAESYPHLVQSYS